MSESSAEKFVRTNNVLCEVRDERARQDDKWGEQNHDPFLYLTILGEEFGEACQAALHMRYGGPAAEKLRKELVQTAAVAVAAIECLDRGAWTWGGHGDCAARVRAAGCLADSGDYGGACWVIGGEGEYRLARTPEEHDPMCPQALAAAIEEGKP